MLSNAGLSREFLLAEAFSTAYYLVNRSPHSSLEFKTPEEVWSGSPPNYSDWKIFLCPFYLVTGVKEEASKGKTLLSSARTLLHWLFVVSLCSVPYLIFV
jgi:hypothetical protein